jgi:hypothetical protein
MNSPTESEKAERCNQCGQEIIEIDNGGMRLIGCLTCNLWSAEESERWVRLAKKTYVLSTNCAIADRDRKRRRKREGPDRGEGLGPSRFLCGTE